MDGIVLCAGYGTRLYPLTENTPKPLLEVGGKPILGHILEKLVGTAVSRVFLVSNARFADAFTDWVSDVRLPGLELHVVNDGTTSNEDRLGSIGDIRYAAAQQGLSDDFLVINGDNLFTFALEPMLRSFRERGNTVAVYDVRSLEAASLYGAPTLDTNLRVTGFVEKPPQPATTLVSIGIYAYRAEVHCLLAQYLSTGGSPDTTGEFVEWLHQQTDVFGYAYRDAGDLWFDIGSLEQLEEARRQWGG
jgi:glucose-1-phosphate thymidylyltransferase